MVIDVFTSGLAMLRFPSEYKNTKSLFRSLWATLRERGSYRQELLPASGLQSRLGASQSTVVGMLASEES